MSKLVRKCLSCGYTDDPPRPVLTKVTFGQGINHTILVDVYEIPAFVRKRPGPRYWVTPNFCSYCLPRISLVSPEEKQDAPAQEPAEATPDAGGH